MMDAVRLAIIGGMLWAAGAAALVLGVLPPDDALAIGERVWPILLFVVAMTVVAELAAAAGLFGACAAWLARVSRGHGWLLWGLVFALAAVTTAFLSLDTTAVLLTPVVIAVARANGVPALPFALTTVWVANTGSLLLPVSNLTNLLARERLGGIDPWQSPPSSGRRPPPRSSCRRSCSLSSSGARSARATRPRRRRACRTDLC